MITRSETIAVAELRPTALGVCPSRQPPTGSPIGLYSCQNALFYPDAAITPEAKAARAEALADLRAARSELRRLKRCWRLHYVSDVGAGLDKSSSTSHSDVMTSISGSVSIPSRLAHVFRKFGSYTTLLKAESGQVKELSNRLRRRLIHDGFGDSKMIDDQMAYDLGL